MQALGVLARHVAHHVDQTVAFEVAALVGELAHHLLLGRDRLQIHHRRVAAALEGAVLVQHVGDAAGHAGREVAPGLTDHDHHAAGHVLAAVVARALDDGDGARVAHREPLAGDAGEVALAAIAP